jgi:hypothetical protein
VYPEDDMRLLIEQAGFDLVSHAHNLTWSADRVERRASTAGRAPEERTWHRQLEDGVGTRECLGDHTGVAMRSRHDVDALACLQWEARWVARDDTNGLGDEEGVLLDLMTDVAHGRRNDGHVIAFRSDLAARPSRGAYG